LGCAVKKGKEMKFWLKTQMVLQGSTEELVVGVCDEELLGKSFGPFKISEHFFKGNLVEPEKAINVLKRATIANLVGKNIINAAVRAKMVDKKSVKTFKKIPHVQIFLV
jgi:hypothetical protein